MINPFSSEVVCKVTLINGQCDVLLNGSLLISGTSNQCMSKIRNTIMNSSYRTISENSIKFIIDSKITSPQISPQIADDKNYFVNQLRLLATSCKCKFKIQAGIHFIS